MLSNPARWPRSKNSASFWPNYSRAGEIRSGRPSRITWPSAPTYGQPKSYHLVKDAYLWLRACLRYALALIPRCVVESRGKIESFDQSTHNLVHFGHMYFPSLSSVLAVCVCVMRLRVCAYICIYISYYRILKATEVVWLCVSGRETNRCTPLPPILQNLIFSRVFFL